MSWSVQFIGQAENVIKALEEHASKQTGQSKVELEDAVPHLSALVKQNFHSIEGVAQPLIKLEASGHGYVGTDGREQNRSCTVKIEQLYGVLV